MFIRNFDTVSFMFLAVKEARVSIIELTSSFSSFRLCNLLHSVLFCVSHVGELWRALVHVLEA